MASWQWRITGWIVLTLLCLLSIVMTVQNIQQSWFIQPCFMFIHVFMQQCVSNLGWIVQPKFVYMASSSAPNAEDAPQGCCKPRTSLQLKSRTINFPVMLSDELQHEQSTSVNWTLTFGCIRLTFQSDANGTAFVLRCVRNSPATITDRLTGEIVFSQIMKPHRQCIPLSRMQSRP